MRGASHLHPLSSCYSVDSLQYGRVILGFCVPERQAFCQQEAIGKVEF